MFLAVDSFGVGSFGTGSSVINGAATAAFSSVTATVSEGTAIGDATASSSIAGVSATNSIISTVIGDAVNIAANIVDATAAAPPSAIVTGEVNISGSLSQITIDTLLPDVSVDVSVYVSLATVTDVSNNITAVATGDASNLITGVVNTALSPLGIGSFGTSSSIISTTRSIFDTDVVVPVTPPTVVTTGDANTSAVAVQTNVSVLLADISGDANTSSPIADSIVQQVTAVVIGTAITSGLFAQSDIDVLLPDTSGDANVTTSDFIDVTVTKGTGNAAGSATASPLIVDVEIGVSTAFAYEGIKPIIIPRNLLIADSRYKVLIADSRYKTITVDSRCKTVIL